MLELARQVLSLTGSRSRIEFRSLPENDPRQRQPDITRARALLDWNPRVGLVDGLKSTIAYFDDLLGKVVDSESDGAMR